MPRIGPYVSLARVPGRYGAVRRAYMILTLAMITALFLHAFAHMIFAGARLGRTDEARVWAVVDWPIVDVPVWPMVLATGVGAGLLVALMVLAGRGATLVDVPVLAMLGAIAYGIVPLGFATWFGDASDLPITWNDEAVRDGTTVGWHGVLAPVAFVLFVVALVRSSAITRAARRRRQSTA